MIYYDESGINRGTNYMAHYCIENTLALLDIFDKNYDASELVHFKENIYLPRPNADHIIPQDDTFLSKPVIDLAKYRNADTRQLILKDFTRREVIDMQILKQADVVMLLYLLRDKFDKDTIERNWRYYEERNTHDSSLSLGIHCIVASYFGSIEKAYEFFEKAERLDIGENIISSDDGVHAAGIGAVWMCIVYAFGGISTKGGGLSICPALPDSWKRLHFPFVYNGVKIEVEIDKRSIRVKNTSEGSLDIEICGKNYSLANSLEVRTGD